MRWIREYRIFIASPSGQDEVREAFRKELLAYNEMDALRRGVTFTAVGWEATLPGPQRPQALINEDLKTCDAFLLVLQDRWGSPPSDEDGSYTSGSHEEFELAKRLLDDTEYPMMDLIVLFRGVERSQLADPGPQLRQVEDFRKELEQSKAFLFGMFDSVDEFQRNLRRHLASWVFTGENKEVPTFELARGSEAGGLPVKDTPVARILSVEDVSVNSAGSGGAPGNLALAHQLAMRGSFTEAESLYAKAIWGDQGSKGLTMYGTFLIEQEREEEGLAMLKRAVAMAAPDEATWKASALEGQASVLLQRATRWIRESSGGVAILEDPEAAQEFLEGRSWNFPVLAGFELHFIESRENLSEAEALLREAFEITDGKDVDRVAQKLSDLEVLHSRLESFYKMLRRATRP